jgi:hypothetical protein
VFRSVGAVRPALILSLGTLLFAATGTAVAATPLPAKPAVTQPAATHPAVTKPVAGKQNQTAIKPHVTTAPRTRGDWIALDDVYSPSTDQGNLSIVLSATSTLTKVNVHIYDSAGTTDLLDPAVTETGDNGGMPDQSIWTVTAPITQTQLQLGEYLVVVDAADTGGTTITGLNQNWFFTASPQITIGADHTDISYDNPSATISGTVTLHAPDGTVTPYVGSVAFNADWPGLPTVKTDSNGAFSTKVTPSDIFTNTPSLSAFVTANGWTASSASVAFTITNDPTKTTATISTHSTTYGSPVSVSGTVLYEPAGTTTYQPLAGKVSLYNSVGWPYAPYATTTASTSGQYHFTLPPGANVWTVAIGGGITELAPSNSASMSLSEYYPTVISGLKFSLSQFWVLSYSGCVSLTAADGGATVPVAALQVQWANSKTGPWHNLAASMTTTGTCGHGGFRFKGSATAPQNYAFYRAYYPPQPSTPAGTINGFVKAVSGTSLVWKYYDRITGFTVSPTSVGLNGYITATGKLQYWYSGWHAYGGQTILILVIPPGQTSWFWVVKVKTNSAGKFTARFRDFVGSAPWAAGYEGNSTHLSAGSRNTVYVQVS